MKLRSCALSLIILVAPALVLACGDGGGNDKGSATPGQTAGASGDANPLATLQELVKTPSNRTAIALPPGETPEPVDALETPLPLSALGGSYDVRFRFVEQPADEDLRDALEMSDLLVLAIDGDTVTITAREPFIQVSGTLSSSGAISATGHGAVESYGEFDATFDGTLSQQEFSGTYTLTGPIPGGSVAFTVRGALD